MSLRAFQDAFRGILDLIQTQRNARIHALAASLVTFSGFWLGLSLLEWAAVVLCIAMVFALEAVNTALEYLTDLISPAYHPIAGKAKDTAAGAVLLGALGAAVVGVLIFGPKIATTLKIF
ncbi:MAG: diacylglycerol kinase family protein [Saprospiraceae bacterium]|nr:diacylglycerol kinase family protein [Saprospiraceae bacterium]MDW8484780.1 diacylglycerol kinase family protein [Saprospiraceae bacterium]